MNNQPTPTIQTMWGPLTVDSRKNGQYHILEVLRGQQRERIFSVTASRGQGMWVSTPEDQTKIALSKDHEGRGSHFRGRNIYNAPTPLGELSLEWARWGDTPIPPGGVVGWIFIYTREGPFQFVTLLADETGSILQASVCTNETQPIPTKVIPLAHKIKKGSGKTWTVNV